MCLEIQLQSRHNDFVLIYLFVSWLIVVLIMQSVNETNLQANV